MQLTKFGVLLLPLILGGTLAGCASTAAPPVVQASPQEVADLKTLRSYFDSVNGDYSQLSAPQKEAFLKYAKGNQGEVDHLWAMMKNPLGGTAPAERRQ